MMTIPPYVNIPAAREAAIVACTLCVGFLIAAGFWYGQ